MWQSIVFQPQHLLKTMLGARVWQKPAALPEGERVSYIIENDALLAPELMQIKLPDEAA